MKKYAENYVTTWESFQIMLPGGRTVVAFCGPILALGRWNLKMSWCKTPGVPRGQPPGMAADKCIICQLHIMYKLFTPIDMFNQVYQNKISDNLMAYLTDSIMSQFFMFLTNTFDKFK